MSSSPRLLESEDVLRGLKGCALAFEASADGGKRGMAAERRRDATTPPALEVSVSSGLPGPTFALRLEFAGGEMRMTPKEFAPGRPGDVLRADEDATGDGRRFAFA